MSANTPVLGITYPTSGDPPDGAAQMQELATDVDNKLGFILPAPVGDGSHSVLLGAPVACAASSRTQILTTTFTLTRAQNVLIAARARVDNQSGSVNPAIAMSVLVDTVVQTLGQAAAISLGLSGSISDHGNLVIQTFAVPLAVGAHTVSVEVDRDAAAATVNVMDTTTINGRVIRPTALSVTI